MKEKLIKNDTSSAFVVTPNSLVNSSRGFAEKFDLIAGNMSSIIKDFDERTKELTSSCTAVERTIGSNMLKQDMNMNTDRSKSSLVRPKFDSNPTSLLHQHLGRR